MTIELEGSGFRTLEPATSCLLKDQRSQCVIHGKTTVHTDLLNLHGTLLDDKTRFRRLLHVAKFPQHNSLYFSILGRYCQILHQTKNLQMQAFENLSNYFIAKILFL